jgi:Abnormal spindle-like microcephaly-assoc'd, ASPM-SPD-2-Hydin
MRRPLLARYVAVAVLLWGAVPIAICGNGGSGGGASRQLAASPSTLNFGTVTAGTSASLTITVSNTGGGNVNLKQASLSGGSFTLNGPMLPVNLAPGQSASFTVTFAPAAAGSAVGSVAFVSNATNSPASVSMAGTGATGYGQLAANPTNLSFGTVTVGTTSILPVIISNTGTASTTISQDSVTGTGLSLSGPGLPVSLAPGQSVSLAVTYAPAAAGSTSGQATVAGNAPNSPVTVPVSGSATSSYGQIALSPTSLSFGNVTVGATSTLPVAVSNTGTGNTTLSQDSLTGSGFTISGLTLPLTLVPGQSASFNVSFDPTSTTSFSGAISLVSDAMNSPSNLPLSGSGVTHSVSLSWTASTSTVAGYNVYRGTQSGGPYALMNPSLDTGTAYTDTTVLAGQTYYYVTTAVSSTGVESGYSSQIQAIIPSP